MNVTPPNSFRTGPDENGLFGIYGGRFVAETLMPLILELEQAYKDAKADPSFQTELDSFLEHYVGRPVAGQESIFTNHAICHNLLLQQWQNHMAAAKHQGTRTIKTIGNCNKIIIR